MIQIYKTIDGIIKPIEDYEKNCWIRMTNPTQEEIDEIAEQFNIEEDYLTAALDREEMSRVEEEEDNACSLITFNVPKPDAGGNDLIYKTIPIGIIETPFCIVTVCIEALRELNDFVNGRIRHAFTNLRTRFILQILYCVAVSFVTYLRAINKKSQHVEAALHASMRNKELFQMHDLEKSTVFFSTALKSNQMVLEKLQRGRILKLYEDDKELLEDVLIEIDQAITMCSIYSNILSGTMDAFASIISNNLNVVMKILTAITILLAVPTMISGIYGMNVTGLPMAQFWPVMWLTIAVTGLAAVILYKYNMFS